MEQELCLLYISAQSEDKFECLFIYRIGLMMEQILTLLQIEFHFQDSVFSRWSGWVIIVIYVPSAWKEPRHEIFI